MSKKYNEIIKRINELDCKLENHIHSKLCYADTDSNFVQFSKNSKYIGLWDCYKLIPFNIFDLYINGKLCCRGCIKENFSKMIINLCYGTQHYHNITSILDIRISLRESLVDLIVEEE